MHVRTDRGLLVVQEEADGTTSLAICARVVAGRPVDVYAQHFRPTTVNIDSDVSLTTLGKVRYSDGIVEVFSHGDGVVNVRYPRYADRR